MKYKICEGRNQNGVWIWSVVAWSDMKACATEVMWAMSRMTGKKYAVLSGGKVVAEK